MTAPGTGRTRGADEAEEDLGLDGSCSAWGAGNCCCCLESSYECPCTAEVRLRKEAEEKSEGMRGRQEGGGGSFDETSAGATLVG